MGQSTLAVGLEAGLQGSRQGVVIFKHLGIREGIMTQHFVNVMKGSLDLVIIVLSTLPVFNKLLLKSSKC